MSPVTGSVIASLPLSDPRCKNATCKAFEDATNRSQALTPFGAQFRYGHWVVYFFVFITLLFTLANLYSKVKHFIHKHSVSSASAAEQQKPRLASMLLAAGRFVGYRQVTHASPLWAPPSAAFLTLASIVILFLTVLTFAKKPYYRAREGYGSPPIAVRTGLMSFACIPFLVALGGKANLISALTGISHDRLNVAHRWLAWACFVLATVHTIPFFAQAAWTGDLRYQFYVRGYDCTMVRPPISSAIFAVDCLGVLILASHSAY